MELEAGRNAAILSVSVQEVTTNEFNETLGYPNEVRFSWRVEAIVLGRRIGARIQRQSRDATSRGDTCAQGSCSSRRCVCPILPRECEFAPERGLVARSS
jgi:hypothetical protein